MDKRMAYNLRLIGSVTYDCYHQIHQNADSKKSNELIKLVQQKTILEKVQKIRPKIKNMNQWTIQKLNMNNEEG